MPGQAVSVQYSHSPWPEIWTPLLSTEVLHHGASPSIEVHLSWILLAKMKGKTQFPQLVLFEDGDDVDTGDGDGVGDGDGDGVDGEGEGAAVEPEVEFQTPEYGAQVLMSGIC